MNIKLYIQFGDLPQGNSPVVTRYLVRNMKYAGDLIHWQRKRLGRSFVKAFMQHIELALNHTWGVAGAAMSIKDTGNAARTMQIPSGVSTPNVYTLFAALAPAGTVTYGIVVGTGNTAVTTSDYVLETPIAEGAGAGQLNYGAVTIIPTATTGLTNTLQVTRQLTNNSAGDITVTEIALYLSTSDSGNTQRYFCVTRDLVSQLIATGGGTKLAVITIQTGL